MFPTIGTEWLSPGTERRPSPSRLQPRAKPVSQIEQQTLAFRPSTNGKTSLVLGPKILHFQLVPLSSCFCDLLMSFQQSAAAFRHDLFRTLVEESVVVPAATLGLRQQSFCFSLCRHMATGYLSTCTMEASWNWALCCARCNVATAAASERLRAQ